MNKILFVLGIMIMLIGCTSKKDTERALKAQGFTNIKVRGYDMLGCSKDDTFHTKFTATNPAGIEINGTVCSGFLKSATIRF